MEHHLANTDSRYTEKSFVEAVEKMEGYVKCLAPNCKSGQLHGSGHDQPIMVGVGGAQNFLFKPVSGALTPETGLGIPTPEHS